ncbi:MAG: sulfotransferase domain-containing protein [Cyclobacteriaceae bacterium]
MLISTKKHNSSTLLKQVTPRKRDYILVLFVVSAFFVSCNKPLDADDRIPNSTPITTFSIVGSIGHQYFSEVLRENVEEIDLRYVSSLRNSDGSKVKISGHRSYTEGNKSLIKENNLKVLFIYRDPRDNLTNLVYRSLYDWVPSKWKKPGVHPNALSFHRKVKQVDTVDTKNTFVKLFVEQAGTRTVLDSIFSVSAWKGHPRVLSLKLEDLLKMHGSTHEDQSSALKEVLDFLNIPSTDNRIKRLARKSNEFRKKKSRKHEFSVPWQELFLDYDKSLFKGYWGRVLIDLGYEQDYDW